MARVKVRIGTLHRASQGPMEQAFEMVAAGTVLEGAQLELVQMPVISTCRACGAAESSADMALVCRTCGAAAMVYDGGDELLLESIEYLPPEAVAAAPTTDGGG